MQVYNDLNIVTNKILENEKNGVQHHLIGHVSWDTEYSINKYVLEAEETIKDIHNRNKIPIIVGGTNYYLQNLVFKNHLIGSNNNEKPAKELTQEEISLLNGPVDMIFNKLKEIDPIISQKFHPKDKRKLRRCLQICFQQNKKTSEIYNDQKEIKQKSSSLKYRTLFLWLFCDLDILKQRLELRMEQMIEKNFLSEIINLYNFHLNTKKTFDCTRGVSQIIGFKEFLPYLNAINNHSNDTDSKVNCKSFYQEGLDLMKIKTRQYSKYQVKWMKNTLCPLLRNEILRGFETDVNLHVLDTTEEDLWDENVLKKGLFLSKEFLSNFFKRSSNLYAPDGLEYLISKKQNSDSTENVLLTDNLKWKHYTCPHCLDKKFEPFVAVGLYNWNIHIKSKKHKKNQNK